MASRLRLLLAPVAVLSLSLLVAAACGARSELDRAKGAPQPEPECGDAVVNGEEQCDEGVQIVGDDCLDDCTFAFCGDGELRAGEACDDGNTQNGDGCEADCSFSTCGDGVLDPGEACDDQNPANCTPNCTFPICGDGFVAPFEECDEGAENGRVPALSVVSVGVTTDLLALPIDVSVVDYFAFDSASAHTGLEEPFKSFLHPVFDPSGLFLLTIHNIDQDSSGIQTGDGEVHQRFTGLPSGATALFADDNTDEFFLADDGSIVGDWEFHDNTDGGIIGPLTFPGQWVIHVDSDFIANLDTYVVEHDGPVVSLEMSSTAYLVAQDKPGACTPECTLPRCGDGYVDGGEVCDDGDGGQPGGPCNASCSGFN